MKTPRSKRLDAKNRYIWAAVLTVALAAACAYLRPARSFAAEQSLLAGRITSLGKQALPGVPVRAHRENSNITVSVYSNSVGEYSFPGWSDLSPGTYSVTIGLPDFEPVERKPVVISAQKTTRVDFELQPRQPLLSDARTDEIALAEPGTDDQRFLLTQCSECHSLQWALLTPRTREEWFRIVKMMGGGRRAMSDAPGTRAFAQKQYMEQLADYLATIRGPDSSSEIPFKLRPRPTADASTRLVVTEYDIPRSGSRDVYMIRGPRSPFAWPHDVIVDSKYAWYTDHYSYNLGRLDKKTGEVKEIPYTGRFPGREPPEEEPAKQNYMNGADAGVLFGAHKIAFDPQGNIVFGMPGATFRFDPKTEQFTHWPSGNNHFGIDPAGNVWHTRNGVLTKLDTKTGEVKDYEIPRNDGTYDMATDSEGRSIINIYRGGKIGVIGVFDPKTEKYTEYPSPTPGSGPRRGKLDAKDREWVGLFFAGMLGRFDPNTGELKEYPLLPGTKPFGPPFLAPYTAAVDDKNQLVWTTDFNSSRLFLFDMKTEKATEFYMPLPYEVRDLWVDTDADRPTVWIPAHRPPTKLVKVQVR